MVRGRFCGCAASLYESGLLVVLVDDVLTVEKVIFEVPGMLNLGWLNGWRVVGNCWS